MILSVSMNKLESTENNGTSPLTIKKVYESSKNLADIPHKKEFVKNLIDLMNLILPDHKIEESTYHDPEQMLEKIGPSVEKYLKDIKEVEEAQLVIYCFDGLHRLLFCTDNDFPEKNGLTLGHSDKPDPEVQKRFDSLNLTEDDLKGRPNA
jgi:hypothetical protein